MMMANENMNTEINTSENDNILTVKGLTKLYGKHEVLRSVDFSIKRGSICGLVGPNGAGKTTIMKILGGLVFPTAGTMSFTDREGSNLDILTARRKMSFMIETPYLKKFANARQNLEKQRLQKGIADKSVIDEVLELTGLASVDKKKQVRSYSLGMCQRLGIANALMCDPELLVLDEPINGLDPVGIHDIRDLLIKLNREKGVTILISSHILSELSQLCTDYIFIGSGSIIGSTTAEQLAKDCTGHLTVKTTDNAAALEKLSSLGLECEADETGELITIYGEADTEAVSRALYDIGAVPLHIARADRDLEKYYLETVLEGHTEEAIS